MEIAMYAIIGAKINAPASYWIIFTIYCVLRGIKAIYDTIKEV